MFFLVLHRLVHFALVSRVMADNRPNHHWHVGGLGSDIDFAKFADNAVGLFSLTIGAVCTVLFLIGALYMVTSTGSPDRLGKGQKLMTESLIGLAITLGAYGILRTLYSLVY